MGLNHNISICNIPINNSVQLSRQTNRQSLSPLTTKKSYNNILTCLLNVMHLAFSRILEGGDYSLTIFYTIFYTIQFRAYV